MKKYKTSYISEGLKAGRSGRNESAASRPAMAKSLRLMAKTGMAAVIAAATIALAACGSQKAAVSSAKPVAKTVQTNKADEKARIDFLDKVNSNASYQKNIAAAITFRLTQGNGKEISVPGQLRMRKDEVIRLSLQVPILGTEVGRIEFAKDYVLFVDRMHKEYVKAKYSDVGFLRDNGINFYSLQALFWNRLLLPGKSQVNYTDLDRFSADINGTNATIPVVLKDGKMTYTWTANRANGVISRTKVEYKSAAQGTSALTWDYSNFTNFGSKMFPYGNTMTITTPAKGKAKELKASYTINNITTANDWETTTTLSNKYRQVSVEEILGKLSNI